MANKLGYPVLVRPSYVLGGQGMEIAYSDKDIAEYMEIITRYGTPEHPILVDKYLTGMEIEVDAISDGKDFLIPGIMEHIERAGVHSGDSISVYPAFSFSEKIKQNIIETTKNLCKELNVIGMINIQYILSEDKIYVIEVNPRSSRTVPYISKVTGVPMIELATKCMMGQKLADMPYGTGLHPERDFYAVKVPVFSFEKLPDLEISLGPEMKSTGEVLGISRDYSEAVLKGLMAAGYNIPRKGNVFMSVADIDKPEATRIAEDVVSIGYKLYATSGTAHALNSNYVPASLIGGVNEDVPNITQMVHSEKVELIINTPTQGRDSTTNGFKLRRMAVEFKVPCLTSLDTARALIASLKLNKSDADIDIVGLHELGK
jgi:carbamoyl-phosphate synthase large subunit